MASESLSKRRILILYGTQTGCAREVAERIGREVKTRCLFRSRVIGLDEYDATNLIKEPLIIFVVSTTGQGDTPDNMKSFWRFLLRKGLPLDALSHLSFVVFGLGDSSYVKFNFVGKRLFRRLVQLGGQPLLRRGDGDDQHPFGLDGELDPWLLELWKVLLERYPLPMGVQLPDPNSL
jgi:sulfite reductase alpha subunit-like flavoprotein